MQFLCDTSRVRCGLLVGFVGILIGCTAVLLLTRNPLSLDDGLRHIAMAERYREQGIRHIPDWGHAFFRGYFAEHPSDPWFLAHVAYVPFTRFSDLLFGLKLATLASIAVLLLAFLIALRPGRLPAPLPMLLLLLFAWGSVGFTGRLFLGRPFVLVTAFFLTAYALALRGPFVFLFPLLALATLFSHLFIFPLGLCMLAALFHTLRRAWRPAIACAGWSIAGVVLGLALHPHRVAYLSYLSHAFLPSPFLQGVDLPEELRSGFAFGDIAPFLVLAVIALIAMTCMREGRWRTALAEHPPLLFNAALTLGCGVLFFRWVRAIDVFWPALLLLLGELLTAMPSVTAEVRRFLTHRPFPRVPMSRSTTIVLLCLVSFLSVAVPILRDDDGRSLDAYRAIQIVPDGSRVLNVDWELFPVLYFLQPSARYARGMDPTFDDRVDPEGSAILGHVLTARSGEEPPDTAAWLRDIRRHFAADYLVLHQAYLGKRLHAELIAALRRLPDLPLIAESENIVVFRLSP